MIFDANLASWKNLWGRCADELGGMDAGMNLVALIPPNLQQWYETTRMVQVHDIRPDPDQRVCTYQDKKATCQRFIDDGFATSTLARA